MTAGIMVQHIFEIEFHIWKMSYLDIPQPQLRAVIRTTCYEMDIIWAPHEVRHTISMTLQSLHQLQLLCFLSNSRATKSVPVTLVHLLNSL